jgi:tetratricopeptide (TPR) repeat protein
MRNFNNKICVRCINRLLILVIFSLLPIGGCIQGQATVSLNPDGSGKVIFETVLDPCGSGVQDYRSYLLALKESLLKSEGIDAWSQADWKVLPSGKYYFRGQAFFKSVDSVVVYLGPLKCSLQALWLADSNEGRLIGLRTAQSQLEERQWQKQNSVLRYKLFSEDMTAVLDGFRMDIIFNLPSEFDKAEGFEKIDSRTVHFLLQGRRMAYLLEYIRQQGLYQFAERCNYDRNKFLNNELLPLYFDKLERLKVYFKGGESIFDYEKDASAASKEVVGIIERLEGQIVKEKIRVRADAAAGPQPPSSVGQTDINKIEDYLRSALVYESKGEYQKALELYRRVIDSNTSAPRFLAQAHYRAGLCCFELGDDESAVKHFEIVIKEFVSQRVPAVRSSNMLRDIRSGCAVRKSDMVKRFPEIISSLPQLYSQDVNAISTDGITILFSEPMDADNWFYSSFGQYALPVVTGKPVFDEAGRNWTLPVKLDRGKVYAIAFNGGGAVDGRAKQTAGFRNIEGRRCKPFVLVFSTLNDVNEPTDIDADLIDKSEKINFGQ